MNEKDALGIIEEIQVSQEYTARLAHDKIVHDVVFESNFAGQLYQCLSMNAPSSKQRKLIVNLAKAKARDKINQVGSLPDIRVADPVGIPSPEDGPFWAEFVKKIILSHWRRNSIDLQLWDMAMGMSIYGRCPVQVFPDFEKKEIMIFTRHPSSGFAVPKSTNKNEYEYVVYIDEIPGRNLLKMYPKASACEVTSTSDKFTLTEYWDDNYRFVFANGKKIPGVGVHHSLGFNPNRIIPNAIHDPWASSVGGLSDIYQEIPLLENINELILMGTEERRRKLKSHLVIENPRKVPEGIENMESGVIEVEQGGRVYYVSQVDNPSSTIQDISHQEDLFRKASNFPPQSSGYPISSGTVTGKGWTASLGGVSQDAATTQSIIGANMIKIDEYALKMEKQLFGKTKQKAVGKVPEHFSGEGTGQDFVFHYEPQDIPDDFIHNLEFYALGVDIPTRIVNLLQLHGQKIISTQSVQEKIPGIDAAEELRRLATDRQRELKMMQMAQSLAGEVQGQQQGTPEEIEQAAYATEKGAM